ncbi:fibroblast growth factor receptor-like 1 [Brachionus plicatilis]|uniref:Fibroblast growth factor receptor-like 1 n=1 Tax=Brachionus plicatilis TaxID=10195 RepID=A0A3M7R8I7_BRAPC|nr:fibroblast growth factor receptor-like 1 [Brachionus plicatilis]
MIFLLLLISFAHCLEIELVSNSSQLVSRGQAIDLICPLSHNQSSFLLSWYKDGNKISAALTNNRFKMHSAKLTISHFLKIDKGSYNCELITGQGQIILSSFVHLTSNSESNQSSYEQVTRSIDGHKPQFVHSYYTASQNQYLDASIEFDCLAGGLPKPSVLWYKNGRVLSEEEYGIVRNLMVFKLNKLLTSDSGEYRCQVFNQFGEINRHFKVDVIRRQKVKVGHNRTAKLECSDHISNWFVKYKNKEYLREEKIVVGEDVFYLFSSDLLNQKSLMLRQVNWFTNGLYVCYGESKVKSEVYDLEVEGFIASGLEQKGLGEKNDKLLSIDYPLPVIIIIVLSLASFVLITLLALYYLVKLRKGSNREECCEDVKRSFDNNQLSHGQVDYFKTRRSLIVPCSSNVPLHVYPLPIFRSQMIRPTQSTPQYYHSIRQQDLPSNISSNSVRQKWSHCGDYQSARIDSSSVTRSSSYRSCSKF